MITSREYFTMMVDAYWWFIHHLKRGNFTRARLYAVEVHKMGFGMIKSWLSGN